MEKTKEIKAFYPAKQMAGKPAMSRRVLPFYKCYGNIGLGASMKYILVVLLLTIFAQAASGQEAKEHRRRGQVYFEDSTHVFWTSWPNPFSPPTVSDTTKGLLCGTLTFFCDLTDSVQVAIVEGDSDILTEATVTSSSGHDFSVCYWVAGPRIKQSLLPPNCYRRENKYPLSMLLIVNGRKKCLIVGVGNIPKGWYCWIDEGR